MLMSQRRLCYSASTMFRADGMSVQVHNVEKDGMESETSRRAAESTKLP